MGGSDTHTLSELETRSGFDKRTIAYYVQEGLLPKVYWDVKENMYPYASRSLLAGLQMLEEEGLAQLDGEVWTLLQTDD